LVGILFSWDSSRKGSYRPIAGFVASFHLSDFRLCSSTNGEVEVATVGAHAAVTTITYDLCVQGQGKDLTQSVRLTLIIDGPDPGDHAALLGALTARRGWAREKSGSRF
jgi:hypothetical protein